MGDKTGISWSEATWNPVVGCSIVSPGCTNCYAMQQAARIVKMQPDSHYVGTTKEVNGHNIWTGVLKQAPEHILTAPLRWKKPRLIFVNSMSDLFHESVPDEWIDRVFTVMLHSARHKFQILTKRSKRMRDYVTGLGENRKRWRTDTPRIPYPLDCITFGTDPVWPLPNVWLGVSAEDQTRAEERIPDLLETPAAVRFVSYEPALGPIHFMSMKGHLSWMESRHDHFDALHPNIPTPIDWIIYGGESGDGFRADKPDWAESVMQQCKHSGRTAFYYKQDSGLRSGKQGRASAELWRCKEFPK